MNSVTKVFVGLLVVGIVGFIAGLITWKVAEGHIHAQPQNKYKHAQTASTAGKYLMGIFGGVAFFALLALASSLGAV